MSQAQKEKAIRMIGKISREEIAKKLDVSVPNLKRSLKGYSLWFHNGKYVNRPEIVKEVISYYKNHTLEQTVKKFSKKGIKAKSIIDRPEYYGFNKHKKITKWTVDQIIEAVKMSGLISYQAQAKFFNRPNANEGSIKALFSKKFDGYSGLNGMAKSNAIEIVKSGTKFLRPYGNSRSMLRVKFRHLILWVDLEKNIKPEAPNAIKAAVKTMADFQRWIWRSENPKPLIFKMMREREA